MKKLDTDKLLKVLAMAGSDQDGEALAALRKAQGMLKDAGKTFGDLTVKGQDRATKAKPSPAAGPTIVDIFAGFDDHMEAKQPGWKAKQAEARAERTRREADERAAAIARYGSLEQAKQPCPREQRLNEATAHLKRTISKEYANGTFDVDSLDGWTGGFDDKMPDSVMAAVAGAYPMPSTLRDARDEALYWTGRNRELERVWTEPGSIFGADSYLGLAADARRMLVDDLWRKGPIATLDDLQVRIECAASEEWRDLASDAMPGILEAFNRLVPNAPVEGISPVIWKAPLRLVLKDVPGQCLALALHDQDGEKVAVNIKPTDALALAVDLTSSTRQRMKGGAA
ncbi:hypothetical protein [Azospirillum rugosum]|uniref:DUF2786 domain-containing protein n=1 Tax=Azospirillum rugosum TaxID=416170 RepID=A0ABS4SGC7_9PROT|nr:hypothetical protein [Azospirillum rugosum]MBP2291022.1 hypothetical protein [Azospirillum rugosum]MDQ0524914.1 hypothetical protein [Azospirillum rugosum]